MAVCELSKIFNVSYGTKLDMNKMTLSEDGVAFVSRTSKNNGVVACVKKQKGVTPLESGKITVTLGGTYVLSSFLQERPFYTAQNVAVLSPLCNLTREQKLYYCMCISSNRFRYSAFGREANRTLHELKVPILKDIPKWVQEINVSRFDDQDAPISHKIIPVPKAIELVRLDELFTVKNGIPSTGLVEHEERNAGLVMFIRPASTQLRTRRSFICSDAIDSSQVYPPESLFVSTNGEGSHTYSYVSTEKFVANSDVAVLLPKQRMSLETKIFYAKCISANRYRFSYGRKPKGEKLKKLMLPKFNVEMNNKVKEFMRSLKFSSTALLGKK